MSACPAVRALLWTSAALIAWTQAGYGLFLAALRRLRETGPAPPPGATTAAVSSPLATAAHTAAAVSTPPPTAAPSASAAAPHVSLIVAAHDEEAVIAAKVANALALDYPRDRLEVIVACDGVRRRHGRAGAARPAPTSCSSCRAAARSARRTPACAPRARRAAGVPRRQRDCWEPDALRALVAPFADPRVGYACGQVAFVNEGGTNQEGLYWRYEMALRGSSRRSPR